MGLQRVRHKWAQHAKSHRSVYVYMHIHACIYAHVYTHIHRKRTSLFHVLSLQSSLYFTWGSGGQWITESMSSTARGVSTHLLLWTVFQGRLHMWGWAAQPHNAPRRSILGLVSRVEPTPELGTAWSEGTWVLVEEANLTCVALT